MNTLFTSTIICIFTSIFFPLAGLSQSSPYKINYRHDQTISDKNGKPISYKSAYFPADKFIDSSARSIPMPRDSLNKAIQAGTWRELENRWASLPKKITTRPDTFKLRWFSFYLNCLQEPILFNYPLRKDIYRLSWMRAFRPPVVIKLEGRKRKIWVITKVLRDNPQLPGQTYFDREGRTQVSDTLTKVPFRKNNRKKVPGKQYKQFLQLLTETNVLATSPLGLRYDIGSDGSSWILESHRSEGYYFVTRWEPASSHPLRKIGEFLINLSDYNDKRD